MSPKHTPEEIYKRIAGNMVYHKDRWLVVQDIGNGDGKVHNRFPNKLFASEECIFMMHQYGGRWYVVEDTA